MFYECRSVEKTTKGTCALVSLTPAESKRLIAKGTAAMPEVRNALENGWVIIARGSTNAFVAEEILKKELTPKSEYATGCIVEGELRINSSPNARTVYVMRQGSLVDTRPQEAIKEFGKDDVFIKGASAVDGSGEVGVLAAGTDGGTIGYALPTLLARSAHLIVPVGLEKLIPSVAEASRKCGVFNYEYSTGLPCALIPVPNAKVVTEIQAFGVLAGVSGTHVASGGIGGSEGAVVLVLEGNKANIERALALVREIKGEAPVTAPGQSAPVASATNYAIAPLTTAPRR